MPLPHAVKISSTPISFQSKNLKLQFAFFKAGNMPFKTCLRYVEPGRAFAWSSSVSCSSGSPPINTGVDGRDPLSLSLFCMESRPAF